MFSYKFFKCHGRESRPGSRSCYSHEARSTWQFFDSRDVRCLFIHCVCVLTTLYSTPKTPKRLRDTDDPREEPTIRKSPRKRSVSPDNILHVFIRHHSVPSSKAIQSLQYSSVSVPDFTHLYTNICARAPSEDNATSGYVTLLVLYL